MKVSRSGLAGPHLEAILDFQYSYLSCLKNYRVEILDLSLLPPNLLLGPILEP